MVTTGVNIPGVFLKPQVDGQNHARSQHHARAGRHVASGLDHRLARQQRFRLFPQQRPRALVGTTVHSRHGARTDRLQRLGAGVVLRRQGEAVHHLLGLDDSGRFPDYLEPSTNNHRMYFTTTRDFQTFTPTKLFLDPDFSVIDCQILKDEADRYVLLLKDNTRPQRNIRVAFGDTPLGPWRDISTNLTTKLHRRSVRAEDRRRLAHLLRILPRNITPRSRPPTSRPSPTPRAK
jgi:hypothetical protein